MIIAAQFNALAQQLAGHSIITKLYTEKLIVFSQSSVLIAKRGLQTTANFWN